VELMNKQTEEAIRLLTRLARGDVALVRSALLKHERNGVDSVIEYIRTHRNTGQGGTENRSHSAEPQSGAAFQTA
jgi:hypothetical protein